MDAGRFDSLTAYAAVNTIRIDDLRPHLWRTHDGGKTWQQITNGIPDGGVVNVVREDRVRRGLLFAGTEQAVYVSFDDGDHWQSLRLNMPATSIRDLVIKDNDVVLGTHGRSFWILDDISPLRQMNATTTTAAVHLYRPGAAYRFRWDQWPDTPLPPDEPAGENPPDGALIDYSLASAAHGPVVLEILDAQQQVVRRYSSDDKPIEITDIGNVPSWWIRPTRILSGEPGMHRFVWDLHWSPPPGAADNVSFSISATPHNTAPQPLGPWVLPGTYTVRLTVNGTTQQAPLTVRMDPRVKTSPLVWQRQYQMSLQLYRALRQDSAAQQQVRTVRAQLNDLRGRATGELLTQVNEVDAAAAAVEGAGGGGRGRGGRGGGGAPGLAAVAGQLASLMEMLQDADVTPTTQLVAAITSETAAFGQLLARWQGVRTRDLPALNARLRAAGLPEVGGD